MEAMNDKNNPFNQKCQRCCCCCCCPPPYPPPPPPSGLGSFTAVKRDGGTNLPLAGAVYSLYRLNNAEPAATAASDITGALRFTDLEPGEYILSETTAPEGYQSNPETFMVVVDEQGNVTINGEIAEGFSIYDTLAPQPARFLFLKTDGQTGQPLSGAVFRLLSGETAASDDDGVVDFGFLLPGTYTMTEVSPPDGYDSNTEEYAVTVNPDGSIYVNGVPLADFTVANTSNVPLESFFWHDRIPTDIANATVLSTGTYSARLTYRILYKTNYSASYQVLASNLLSSNNYSFALNAIPMQAGEVVTDIYFDFGTVPVGFQSVANPTLSVMVKGMAVNGYQMVNRADAGGKYQGTWQTATANWITIVRKIGTTPKLPKTGY